MHGGEENLTINEFEWQYLSMKTYCRFMSTNVVCCTQEHCYKLMIKRSLGTSCYICTVEPCLMDTPRQWTPTI